MPPSDIGTLSDGIAAAGNLSDRFLSGIEATVTLGALFGGSSLGGRAEELRGRSVLVWTRDQLTTALALIELDGVARRLVLCPADFSLEHLPFVVNSAAVDAIVSDREPSVRKSPALNLSSSAVQPIHPRTTTVAQGCARNGFCSHPAPRDSQSWCVHTLASLAGAIGGVSPSPAVWSTFYDIRRYGGLRVFLRALLTGASMVMSSTEGSHGGFSDSGCRISSHAYLRNAIPLAAGADEPCGAPPRTAIRAPVRGNCGSGHPGPAPLLLPASRNRPCFRFYRSRRGLRSCRRPGGLSRKPDRPARSDVEMKVEDGSLRIRSTLVADRYLAGHSRPLTDADGFVDTGDLRRIARRTAITS